MTTRLYGQRVDPISLNPIRDRRGRFVGKFFYYVFGKDYARPTIYALLATVILLVVVNAVLIDYTRREAYENTFRVELAKRYYEGAAMSARTELLGYAADQKILVDLAITAMNNTSTEFLAENMLITNKMMQERLHR